MGLPDPTVMTEVSWTLEPSEMPVGGMGTAGLLENSTEVVTLPES